LRHPSPRGNTRDLRQEGSWEFNGQNGLNGPDGQNGQNGQNGRRVFHHD